MAFVLQYITVNGKNLAKERESNHSIIIAAQP